VESWGSWQFEHSMPPSRTGWWEVRNDLTRMVCWQLKQVSLWVAIFSCALGDLGMCTLWQDAQLTLRRSCTPPAKLAWCPLSWHWRLVAAVVCWGGLLYSGA